MILLVTLLLLAAVLIFVGAPLLRPAATVHDQASTPAAEQRAHLLSERETALETLRDLEFERGIGNLDDEDYAALRGAQRHKAVAILRELETLGAEADLAPAATPPTAEAPALDARLEAEIARVRRRLAASLLGDVDAARCPACDTPHAAGARFCTECGERFLHAGACPACGAPRATHDKFCAGCGVSFEQEDGEG